MMDRSDESMTELCNLPVTSVADLLLAAVLRRRTTALILEPVGDGHGVTLERGVEARLCATLPASLGDAVAARLAFIADLDVAAPHQQLGRVRVRHADEEGDLLVMFRATPQGLGAELRRIVDARVAAGAEEMGAGASGLGAYRIVSEIGRGGVGAVFRGVHESLERPVALKILYPESAQDPERAARFVREARAASRARHPNIVEVMDFGRTGDGRAFLVMELVEAPTLETIIARDGALEPARAVGIARQIAAALDAAHEVGVIHRDLKPANVFVDEVDFVKIGDFGAAKVDSPRPGPQVTQKGTVFGTPHYMSPEHARGLPTDRRTDLYALGCVLFEMLTGHVPFDAPTSADVMALHLTQAAPRPVSSFGPLPHALERAVTRALAKLPSERYQTANEMIGDLDRASVALSRSGWRRLLPL